MANRLKSLRLEEISLVDEPASPGAVVILAKNRTATPKGVAVETVSAIAKATSHLNQGKGDSAPMSVTKEDLTKALEAALGPIAKRLDAHDTMIRKASMSDDEKAAYEKMSDDEKAAYDAMSEDDKAAKMKKMDTKDAKKEDDEVAKARSDVAKSIAVAVEKATAPLMSRITDFEKREARTNIAKKYEKAIKASGLDADEVVAILAKADDATRELLTKSWESLGAQVEALFTPVGKASAATGSSEQKLETLAKNRSTEKNISFEKAYDEVLTTDEGRRLYAQLSS